MVCPAFKAAGRTVPALQEGARGASESAIASEKHSSRGSRVAFLLSSGPAASIVNMAVGDVVSMPTASRHQLGIPDAKYRPAPLRRAVYDN